MFAGIGGMTLALKAVSKPILYCDCCKHAQDVLRHQICAGNLPMAPIVSDVRELNGPYPADIITAGFPCTGFSTSGSMQGFKNESSALFYELVRVCGEVQPQLVFMENTPWIAQHANIQQVRQAFAGIGYHVKYCIMPAYAVGLPQTRYRWFAVAYRLPMLALPGLDDGMMLPPTAPPRSQQQEDPRSYRRYSLLRNALVPACARFALSYLLNTGNTLVSPKFMKPDLKLHLQDGTYIIQKKLWPTLHGHYARKGSRLTLRTSYDIGTALMYEKDTVPGHVNIQFLEWLMGFPIDWTLIEDLFVSSPQCTY